MMKVWTQQEDNIIKQYYGKIFAKDIPLQNVTAKQIQGRARILKLDGTAMKSARVILTNTKYTFNKNFFSNPNLLNSYWAGFIAADGYMCERDRLLGINLSIKDKEILEAFKKYIEYTGKIEILQKEYNKGFKGSKDKARIQLYAADQCIYDLKTNFNITPRKTYTLKPPEKLNYDNKLAYIIGFIDGDGSIFISKQNKFIISIGSTKEQLDFIKNIFDNIAPSNKILSKPRAVNSDKNFYQYSIGCSRAYLVYQTLLKVNTQYRLQRKWHV